NTGCRIHEIRCDECKIDLRHDFIVDGKLSVGVKLELEQFNTADLRSFKGAAALHLTSTDLQFKHHPIVLKGLEGELDLTMGKGTNSFVNGQGWIELNKAVYKKTEIDGISGQLNITDRFVSSTNVTARFYKSPVNGFASLYLNANPVWYNVGLEVPHTDMGKLTDAMVPDRFQVNGTSYLYVEAVGTVVEPITWASLKFKTEGVGAVHIKELPKLLEATSLPQGKQQLFLLAFDHGEILPYKSAWLNADLSAGTLTVSTYFERATKWFNELEVQPPPFQVPVKLLKQKGWLP
ncbi:MAG: hypothetical protein R3309_16295, partial [Reinekea sp.]|nr:hypothetical protein [Reinekea sp.]